MAPNLVLEALEKIVHTDNGARQNISPMAIAMAKTLLPKARAAVMVSEIIEKGESHAALDDARENVSYLTGAIEGTITIDRMALGTAKQLLAAAVGDISLLIELGEGEDIALARRALAAIIRNQPDGGKKLAAEIMLARLDRGEQSCDQP
jgi:hypothetical protein